MKLITETYEVLQDKTRKAQFRTSSYCSDGGSCVEISTALEADTILVRHSDGSDVLVFSQDEWRAFVAGVKNGEFDV